ncbi:MAG: nitroreductase family protein, partial [Clostridia bacterium]|nr:nitroreductase family protein [Clostridia bacterium]
MNEVLKAIRERRSIRKFRSEMPERKAIDTILEARLYAPSGMNRQPVVTIAFTDKEQRDRLAELNRQ